MKEKKNILVLCTGNSCRSQMMEGYLRFFAGENAAVYSAGIEIHGLNLKAVATMAEDGVDISGHTSNHVDEFMHIHFDYIITVCDNAEENCPYFPSIAERLHQNFPDPSKVHGSPERIEEEFVRVRKMIKIYADQFVFRIFGSMK